MIKMQLRDSIKPYEIRCLTQYVNKKRSTISLFFFEKKKKNLILPIQPSIFTINGKGINNPTGIANDLKSHFVNAGRKLSQKIQKFKLFKR